MLILLISLYLHTIIHYCVHRAYRYLLVLLVTNFQLKNRETNDFKLYKKVDDFYYLKCSH